MCLFKFMIIFIDLKLDLKKEAEHKYIKFSLKRI